MADGTETSGSSDPQVLEEQGILLYHLKQLTKGRSEIAIEETSKFYDPSQITPEYKASLNSVEYENLPNICLIDTKNPSTFLNLLKTDPNTSDLLLRMSTFEISSLVPMIRLFKIFHDPVSKEETILEIPFDTAAKGVQQIYQTSVGRGYGAGITSIEWKQNPKNEAAVASYKVSINMFLQSIEDFNLIRSSTTAADGTLLTAAIQDLLYQRREWRVATNEGTAVYNPDYYSIKLIVGWEISEAGLQSIRENNNRADINDFIDALQEQKEVLYLHFVSHNIEFNENGSINLQINYIGRADSNASDLEKCNVLNTGKRFEIEIAQIKEQISNLEKQNESLVSAHKAEQTENSSIYNFFFDTNAEDTMDDNASNLKDLKEKLKNLQRSSRLAKYNYLSMRMFEKKHLHLFSYDKQLIEKISKLRGVPNLSKETDLKNFEEYAKRNTAVLQRLEQIQEERKKAAAFTGLAVNPIPGTLQITNTNDITPQAREVIQKANGATLEFAANPSPKQLEGFQGIRSGVEAQETFGSRIALFEEVSEANEEFYKLIEGGNFSTSTTEVKGKKHIVYFYLSSLIDAVLEPILNENKLNPNFINKKLRVILGPMTIIDYGSIQDNGKTYRIFESVENSDEKKEKFVKVYEGTPISINIGDIPISLKEFQRWFNEHIVNKNIDTMTFNEFVSLLINDLVLSSISNQLYTYAPKQKARLGISNFSSIVGEQNEGAFANNIVKYKWNEWVNKKIKPQGGGFRLDQSALASLRTSGKNIHRDNDKQSDSYLPSKDYCVIYCLNDAPYERVGDYLKDKEEGILHLYAGESKGVIRSIKFSRIDNPHRRADNILASTSEGRGFSKIIREKYNVTIEMFGNTNLQVGTYVFLSPTYAGASGINVVEKILREIGLGGYYLITEIDNSIEIGEFRTTIKGIWSAFGDGTLNDGDKEYAPVTNGAEVTKGVLI